MDIKILEFIEKGRMMIKLGNLGKIFNRKIKINRKESKLKQKDTPIFESEHQHINITDALRTEIVNNPHKYHNLDIRIRMGKFYTDEEWEEKRNKMLARKLP